MQTRPEPPQVGDRGEGWRHGGRGGGAADGRQLSRKSNEILQVAPTRTDPEDILRDTSQRQAAHDLPHVWTLLKSKSKIHKRQVLGYREEESGRQSQGVGKGGRRGGVKR